MHRLLDPGEHVRILIYPAFSPDWNEAIQGAARPAEVVAAADEAEALRLIGDCEAFVGYITPALLSAAGRLKWIQAPLAGLESYMFPALIDSDVVLSNMKGIYSDVIADHVFGLILGLAHGFNHYALKQAERVWDTEEREFVHLAGQTLGILGLGGIGSEVARRGDVVGMRVIAVDILRKDRPAEVSELWGLDRFDDLLAESDFLVIAAPQTPTSDHLFDASVFDRMKSTAFLINIGRGKIVSIQALTEALLAGKIGGAGLDVYEYEPLPSDSPLWTMPNVILTPHVAARSPKIEGRRLAVLCDNVRRYVNGEAVRNVVTKSAWS
jgi:phosphoglycerate dehydrogenase-like enzyme